MTDAAGTPPSPWLAGLRGRCPRCGAVTLFAGPIRFADRCRACGLDFATLDVGDGPAAFLTLIVGGLVAGLAIWLELAVAPPWWVHALLWPAVAVVLVVGSLRVAKGVLLAFAWRTTARRRP